MNICAYSEVILVHIMNKLFWFIKIRKEKETMLIQVLCSYLWPHSSFFRLAQSTILLWSYAIFVIIRILASFMWRRYGSPSCISIFMILKLMWSAGIGITGNYHACASATAFDLRTYILSSFFIFRSCWKVGNCAFWLSDHFVLYVRFTS